MSIHLKNNYIKVNISKSGAELTSMKKVEHDLEYIWNADPLYWKRHAPVLFPIVGRVVNDEYLFKGQLYQLGQHGFARDTKFKIVNQNDAQVLLSLKWNNQTLRIYPFKFEFYVQYTLVKNQLSIEYIVENLDEQPMFFSIGAHPGFNCPLSNDETFNDYYLEFEAKEVAKITPLTNQGLLQRDKKQYLNNNNIIELNDKVFKEDALIFDHLKSKSVTLKSRKSEYFVKVDFHEFPFLGLWSKATGAPFVCIEPWVGHADYCDFMGDLAEKEDQICLDPLKSYSCQFSITV